MPTSKLGTGDFGDEVAHIQDSLAKHGLEVSPEERKRRFFGPTTREAVRKFQAETGIEATCEVCEQTTEKLGSIAKPGVFKQDPSEEDVPDRKNVPTPEPRAASLKDPSRLASHASEPSIGGARAHVAGVIALEHGAPATNVSVRLYQRGFGGAKVLLNETTTDTSGAYTIPYALQGAANVEVFVVGVDGSEVQLSRTRYGVQGDEQLNLIAPSSVQPLESEYRRLNSAFEEHTGKDPQRLKDASELGERSDFSYLAGATGWHAGVLALASEALEVEARTQIPAEGVYALARAGLPTDLGKLAQISKETVSNTLRRAAEAGVIDNAIVDQGVKAFGEFATDFRFSNCIRGALSSPKDFVAKARISNEDRLAFEGVVRDDKPGDIWEQAKAAGVSDSSIIKLQLQGKLAYLTFNNAELTDHLIQKVSTSPLELIGLGFYDTSNWEQTLRDLAVGDNDKLATLVPGAFSGGTTEERVSRYAAELGRRVRQMDPHAVTVERIAAGKLEGVVEPDGVATFLKNAMPLGFRLGNTPLGRFVGLHEDHVWNGIDDEKRNGILSSVRVLSSLYATSPDDEALSALLLAGFESATSIAKHDYDTFLRRIKEFYPIGSKNGDKSVTQLIFWKAQQQSATVFNIFDGLKRLHSTPYAPGSSTEDAKQRDDQILKSRQRLSGLFPTLENLFGTVDYCECSHCRSVLSPAAYLVDVLHFLDPNEEAWATVKANYKDRLGVSYSKQKPFDVLNSRRPDIKNIALTCENTNTELPYIDIVNEVLEQLMMSDQTPPLIEAYDVGDVASQDLLAEPQNILWSAYVGSPGKKGLRDLVYPVTLPFDLPLETARAFLKELKLPLWRLRECLVRPSTLYPSAVGRTDGWSDVWFERLNLSSNDVAALSRADQWFELFGYETEAEALKTIASGSADVPAATSLRNGKTLARRLGVSYQELLELLRTRFINPEIESLIALKSLGVDPNLVDRHLGEGQALTKEEESEFEAWLKTQSLKPADLAPLRTAAIRQATVVLRSPSAGCDFSQTTLAFDQDPPDADKALARVLRRMNAFVRLQKKLDWETHTLDRALMALMPGGASVSMAAWPDAMKTTLIYLAHVEELWQTFDERVSREEILILWSDIPSTGIDCLYERLFHRAGGIGHDPAFIKRLGRVLQDKTQQIDDHTDAIRQAFQVVHDEIDPILKAANAADRALSIGHLSILMRYAVLAKGLELSISDLLLLISMSEKNPFSPLSQAPLSDLSKDVPWSETIGFVREVELIREAGVDVVSLDRLCRCRGLVDQPVAAADPVLLALAALPAAESQPQPTKNADNGLLVQTLAAQLSAPVGVVERLVGDVLRDATNKPLKIDGFSASNRLVSLRKLRTALDLIQTLTITDSELQYLLGVSEALSPNDLPLELVASDAAVRSLMKGLVPWLELAAARRQFGRSERLLAVLSASQQPIDATNTAAVRERELHEAIAALTGLKLPLIAKALDAIGAKSAGASTFHVPSLADPAKLRRAIEAIRCFTRVGLNPADVVRFASTAIDADVAKSLRSSFKGRYSKAAWRRIAKPVFDGLRKKQRDALVDHLIHVMDGAKYGDTAEKLFEYLLLDPGMEPVVIASRIQLAIASVQLFVQRCLMNLEPEGVDPRIIDNKRWEWMCRYRVWEVNRKMFIWPENWLDPEFRDDKTHLFRDLEGKLLQSDVNEDTVRSSFHAYLKGLEEIARLEMLTMHFEPGVSADGAIIHVVGRTPTAPFKYFYRKCSHGMWTPWEPIDIGIEGEHLLLTAWRGRIYLFWLSFLEQTEPPVIQDPIDAMKPVATGPLKGLTKVKLQLHWAERLQEKWANRASTAGFVPTSFSGVKATTDDEKREFYLYAKTIENGKGMEDDDIEIHITNAKGDGHKFVFFSKLAGPRSEAAGSSLRAMPYNVKPSGSKWRGNGSLTVEFVSAVKQNSEVANPEIVRGDYTILGRGGGFSMLFPSNESLPVPSRTPPAGVGRPTGYIFPAQNAQHIAYRSGDGSIHDLFWTKNGWFYQSPSADAARAGSGEAESAISDPHAYVIDNKGTLCIAYSGSSRIHELVWSQLDANLNDATLLSTGWRIETPYRATGTVDQPQGRPFGGLFLPNRGVVFRTQDGRLRASVESGGDPAWDVSELKAWDIRGLKSTLPLAASDPTGLLMTATVSGVVTVVSRHLFWVGADGDIHELRSDVTAKTWTYTNITEAIKDVIKPAPGAIPAAYAFLSQNTLHVVYRGTDQQIHELWGAPGSWNYNPIGKGFTKAIGDPSGYVTESFLSQHVVYRGENDEVVELWWWAGTWCENILSKSTPNAPKSASDVTGYSFESFKSQHVVYFGDDGGLRELWWAGAWNTGIYELKNPFPDNLGPLASPFFYEAAGKDHTFFVEPYVVETAIHEWTAWIVTTKEYVETRHNDSIFIPLNPDAIRIDASDVGLFRQDPSRVINKFVDDHTFIRTSKGVIKPDSDLSNMTNARSEQSEFKAKLVDLDAGIQSAAILSRANRTLGGF